MKLHAHKVSTVSRPVLLLIAQEKLDVAFVEVDMMTGEHLKEPFTRLNPSRQVPVLEDGDFVLTESSAILKYLAGKFDLAAYPKGLRERAHVNEVMDWFNTGIYRDYGYNLIYPQVYPHHVRSPEDANRVTVEWGSSRIPGWLGVLNDHWLGAGNPYVCGEAMTIADYFGACVLTAGDLVGASFANYPNVERWLGRMKALPAWSQVNDVHYGFAASLKDKPFVTFS